MMNLYKIEVLIGNNENCFTENKHIVAKDSQSVQDSLMEGELLSLRLIEYGIEIVKGN